MSAVLVAGWRGSKSPSGGVRATISLHGGSCQTHKRACADLADGGDLLIMGPYTKGSVKVARHHLRLERTNTPLAISLTRGTYLLAFSITPPWSILLTDAGKDHDTGSFTVGSSVIDLGIVRPSRDWILAGD
jgi:hypothetical protein